MYAVTSFSGQHGLLHQYFPRRSNMRRSTRIECGSCDTYYFVPKYKMRQLEEDSVLCPMCGEEIHRDEIRDMPQDDDDASD